MRRYGDRAAEATLADQRIPEARLEDPDEVDAVSTAISLRRLVSGRARCMESLLSG